MKRNAKALGYAHAMRRRIKSDLPKEASMVSFAKSVVIVDGNAMLKQTEHSRALRKAMTMGLLAVNPITGISAPTAIGASGTKVGGVSRESKTGTSEAKNASLRPTAP